MKNLGAEIVGSLLELLFPARCLACGHPPKNADPVMLCQGCRSEVKLLKGPLCTCCGRQFHPASGGDRLCDQCLKGFYHFDLARAMLRYSPPVTTIISHFKYHGQTSSLKSFRALQKQIPGLAALNQPDLIIPVPLHHRRLRQRGFNQALLLARIFYPNHHHLIDFTVLTRHLYTQPQTGLNGKRRRRNLKNAFRVNDGKVVAGKTVLLVDDVYTTGTTVNECARVLKKAGAKGVEVLTLARVD